MTGLTAIKKNSTKIRQISEYAKKERIISTNVFKMIDVDVREIDEPEPETQIFYAPELKALTDAAKVLITLAREKQKELGVNSDGYIFSITDEPLTYHAVRVTYQTYCQKINTTNKCLHKARKTFISYLIDGQINIKTVKNLAGHAKVSTTYNSYCFDTRTKEKQKELINDIMPKIDPLVIQKPLSAS